MKYFFIFLFSILFLVNCSAQNEYDSLSINYNATTRGSTIVLIASFSEITYTTNSESKKIALSEIQWNEIKKLVSKIDLESIQNLSSNSSNSAVDRDFISSIIITTDMGSYQSNYFDHGSPPIELKKLIDKLFELNLK